MAKLLMIQGTMSNVGKSILCTGLCRVFFQDGYKVAPFKSQNMALNSFVTKDGKEMGRAQVVQAEACGIDPDVRMNPILLKPTSNVGSQVILQGEVHETMKAMDYYRDKKRFIPQIMESFQSLAEEFDIIVIEGAGSPAELNLMENDIVNMGFAKLVDAPVLLVGDIDRGGVFAQLYGTIKLLPPEDQDRIKGVIINKFRGDKAILAPGLETVEELCEKPVCGVLPHLDLDIDDEDSLSERFKHDHGKKVVDISVIALPKVSNVTDAYPFSRVEGVRVHYVRRPDELEGTDFILIPGTKSTMDDLTWLRDQGLEEAIIQAVEKGVLLFGICGGFQMLGTSLEDPFGVEGPKGRTMKGMGLLEHHTVFEEKKVQRQVEGVLGPISGPLSELSGKPYRGYEIHMGQSDTSMTLLGSKGIYGTYVHGFFDETSLTRALLEVISKRREIELDLSTMLDAKELKEQEYDKLAQAVRDNVDMDMIYAMMNEEGVADESNISR